MNERKRQFHVRRGRKSRLFTWRSFPPPSPAMHKMYQEMIEYVERESKKPGGWDFLGDLIRSKP